MARKHLCIIGWGLRPIGSGCACGIWIHNLAQFSPPHVPMTLALISFFATTVPTASVPDSGVTGLLLGLGVIGLGLFARYIKGRKK